MKKILLACNAGMCACPPVPTPEKAAKEKGIEVMITAVGVEAEKILNEWDVCLLGPQVRHHIKLLQEKANGVPVSIIDMRDYGLMNGEKVLETALKMIENK